MSEEKKDDAAGPDGDDSLQPLETSPVADPDPAPVEEAAVEHGPRRQTRRLDPVRIWTGIVLAVVLALLGWYLMADRFTPYTTQARLHALVVPIAPQVSGQVDEVMVTNNQKVSSGDVLFQVNTDTFELQLRTAQADLQAARQAVGSSRADIGAAEANVAAAIAYRVQAQQDAERLREIKKADEGAISDRRLQYAEATLSAAIANVDAAEANLERARQTLGADDETNVRILQAQVAIANARLNIDRATVRAPDDGLVTDVRLDEGNFAAAGSPQMTFIAVDNLWVQADFTENNLGHLDSGDPAQIVFDVVPGEVFEGRVRGTAFGVDVGSAALGSLPTVENDKDWLREAQRFPVLVDFEIENPSLVGLRVGSQASVTVFTGENPLLNRLARWRMKLAAYLSYAY